MEQEKEVMKNGRGGARPGAGRPKSQTISQSITIRIPEDVIEILNRQKNRSGYIIAAIRAYNEAQMQQ